MFRVERQDDYEWGIAKDAEAIVSYKLLFQHLPGVTGENYENVRQDSQSPNRNLNPGPPECKP
jgi:hypothetical protein